jgi:leucyl-tRNA synthetase
MTMHEQIALPVQIGGKARARVIVDTDAPATEIEKLVVVPGRIVKIVAG